MSENKTYESKLYQDNIWLGIELEVLSKDKRSNFLRCGNDC